MAEIQPHLTSQAMRLEAGLLLSQRKGHFFSLNTKVAKWVNKNLRRAFKRHGVLLILKPSYLGISGCILTFAISTPVLRQDVAVVYK